MAAPEIALGCVMSPHGGCGNKDAVAAIKIP